MQGQNKYMERDEPIIAGLMIMAFCAILTLVGIFKAYRELRFIFVGERCIATFTDFGGKFRNKSGERIGKYAKYEFIDLDGNRCTGCDKISSNWQPPENNQLNIIYLLGEKRLVNDNTISKLQENKHFTYISILLLGIIGLIASGYVVYQVAKKNQCESFS